MKMIKERIVHVMVMILCMLIIGTESSCLYLQASEEVSAIEQAKNNVFRIEVSLICDGKSKPKLIRTGTCFMIGNEKKDQKQYLITTKTNLDVDEKSIKNYKKTNKLESNDSVQTVYEIVISDDIRRSAEIYDRAQDSDYAILQIDEIIKGCDGLTFGNLEQTKENAAIFLLTYDSERCQVNLESTHLERTDEKRLFYRATATEGYGTPIIDESGFLLGMRMPPELKNDGLAEGLRADTLQYAFDTLGLGYESSDSKITVLEEKIAEAKAAVESGDYTKKTCTAVQSAIDEAQAVYDELKSTDSDYEVQIDKLEIAMQQLKPIKEVYRLIMIVLGGVMLFLLVVIFMVCLCIRKRKKALDYHSADPVNYKKQRRVLRKKNKTEARTRSAEVDYDATVTLSSKIPTAYLVHQSTGTKLLIAKKSFILGSKEEGTDYQITGNPAVSRKHAAIVNENGIFFLQDLGSKNHSYVNDVQLSSGEKSVLRNRDVIRVANEEFVFELK